MTEALITAKLLLQLFFIFKFLQLMDVGELLQKHNEEEMQKVRKAMRSKILDTT